MSRDVDRVNDSIWEPRKMTVERVFIIKILAYSARKNKAKGPPAYSTLKPETSSDSPSVRSKGARLVSARVETNHIRNRGQRGKINHINSCEVVKDERVNPPARKMAHKMIKARVTSYETV